jgi:tripartite-type tricarboxylate transporter receptor subunit TctC
MAPAGVPRDIIRRLNDGIVKVAGGADMRETFVRQGLDPQTSTPEQFASFIHDELVQAAKLIKASGAHAN